MRYLGKYTKEDILEYKGSGIYWKHHLNSHGPQFVVTDWISDWFLDPSEIYEFATFLSEEFNVVKSDLWANQIPENGIDGGSFTKGKVTVKDPITNVIVGLVSVDDPRYVEGNLVSHNKGMIPVKHSVTGKRTSVHRDNPEYLSGVYVSIRKETVLAKNTVTGDIKVIDKDNPCLQSDEWVGVAKGNKQEILTCPVCSKEGGKFNMLRFHFENCGIPASHTGKKRTKETLDKLSLNNKDRRIFIWKNVTTDEMFIGSQSEFRKQFGNMTKVNTSHLITGYKIKVKGWTVYTEEVING